MNLTVIIMFLVFVGATLVITYFASKRTQSTNDFYTAGGGLTGWQNGLAISGDYLSAASFLGIAGAIALWGFDGFFYSVGYLTAYLVVLYIVAEPLRNLGQYTVADMIAARFEMKKVRAFAALSSITIVIFYMLAQLVGAGALIQLLFDIPYSISVILVGIMMTIYVLFGGMTATSWVQMVKAVLLMDRYPHHLFSGTAQLQLQYIHDVRGDEERYGTGTGRSIPQPGIPGQFAPQ